MATGGDVSEIRWSHPTLGAGVVYAKSGEDSTLDVGGFRVNDDANGIDGGGNLIIQMNRVRAFFEATCANDMNINQDVEKISALASSGVPAEWTLSHANGCSYRGVGIPVGDIQANMNAATFTLKVACSTLKQIK
jgi:hypothetical protein